MTNAKQFLQWAGVILVAVSLLGFIGLLGPTSERSLFQEFWYFDTVENWAHLVLGVVALGAAYGLAKEEQQRQLTMVVGVAALAVGIIGFFLPDTAPNFLGAALQNPADNILHIVVGAWALSSARRIEGATDPMPSPPATA